MKNRKSESGIVMIVCMILLLMLAIIGAASLTTSNTEMEISGNEKYTTAAFYLADAGVEKALAVLQDDVTWRDGFTAESLGIGVYDVQVLDSLSLPYLDNTLLVRSTGRVQGSVRTIEAILGRGNRTIFQYAAYGRNNFNMNGGGMIDSYDSGLGSYASQAVNGPDDNGYMFANENGNIRSDGTITLAGNAQLHGDASVDTSGDFSFGGGTTMYGDTLRTTESIPIDSIPATEIANAQASNDAPSNLTLTGTATYDPFTEALTAGSGDTILVNSGTYYFSSVDVGSGAIFMLAPGAEAVVYITGDWDTSGGAIINSDGVAANLHVYSTGTQFGFSGGTQLCAAIYAPNADIVVTGGSEFFGSVIAKSFVNGGGTTLHFDEALLSLPEDYLAADYEIIGWNEL
ncbi:MAG: PilX N-terminal domain-containing pilus assembly protein [candidate division Zixibacteria bacterium]